MNAAATVSARRTALLTRYVVQEHLARPTRFDLRIERGGVLKSWTVPKGLRLVPGEKHLAIELPDHALEDAISAREIPGGASAAADVRLWDEGGCEVREWTDRRIIVVLRGERLHGCFALLRAPRLGAHHWLFLSLRRPRRAPPSSPLAP